MINSKRYDLEERNITILLKCTQFSPIHYQETTANSRNGVKQVIRSSGSVGANYIEANESLGKKDIALRIRICRKESKGNSLLA